MTIDKIMQDLTITKEKKFFKVHSMRKSGTMRWLLALFAYVCIASLHPTDAFVPKKVMDVASLSKASTSSLAAKASPVKPKFNKSTDKWESAPADDGIYPYNAFGALLRHGPSPFITRVTDPAEYEQYVLNYMADTNCDRAEATGNIDAKLNNAMDWAYQKMEEKKGKPKVDYTVLKTKDAALAVIWAVFIVPLTVSVIRDTIAQLNDGIDAYSTYHG